MQDGHRRVDDAHSHSGDDPCKDYQTHGAGAGLKDRTDQHPQHTHEDGPSSSQRLTKSKSAHGAKEATKLIDGHDVPQSAWTGTVERLLKGGRLDQTTQ